MSKHFYPAVFLDDADGYSVRFPDMEGCFTEGDTIEQAYEMANDAIGLYVAQQDGSFVFPKASKPSEIKVDKGEFVVLIEFDELEYRKRHDNRSVKKTLTIPSWLNEAAERNNINFSATLKEALLEKIAQ